jgi:2-keto-4-pentenoate hydratase/2-oxohepta-3-ene-1,7-dioic acid hydratase in catechol pathway
LIRSGEDIVIPRISKEVHHEVEIVVLIGSGGKKIREDAAHECVFGYGVGLDMTLRDVQRAAKERGWPWAVAKGFDTSAPVSDIIPKERVASAAGLEIRCSVNGAQRQQGLASAMIFSVEKLVSYISALFTLERGDLIFTGTPQGVAKVEPGDLIEAELVGYAKTTHHVRNDE